jgi:hypothetical protein
MTPEEKSNKANDLSAAYARLFNTPDGQRVLGDLNTNFLINNVPPNADHAYFSGCKGVMVYILEQTQHGKHYAHARKS